MDNEFEVIRRAQNGDARAFEELIGQYYDVIFRFAMRFCGNRDDAEDITQNACIRVARSLKSFRYESSFTSWLYRLVINIGKDHMRTKKDHYELDDTLSDARSTAEDAQFARDVLREVHGLPEKEKLSILLVHGQGLTHKDAAEILDVKESTVSWYLHEARKKLQSLTDDNKDSDKKNTAKERSHG